MSPRMGRAIVIVHYDPDWPLRFEQERRRILDVCPAGIFLAIEHVGSTAVPGLGAKPIIDIMPGIRSLTEGVSLVEPLAGLGYEYVPEYEDDLPERRYFRKDIGGRRAFHLHVVETTSEFWRRHLLFRDYLRGHPETAREYELLKRALAERFRADRERYTEAKTEFIRSVEARARAERGEL